MTRGKYSPCGLRDSIFRIGKKWNIVFVVIHRLLQHNTICQDIAILTQDCMFVFLLYFIIIGESGIVKL